MLVLCCVTSFRPCETAQRAPQRMEPSPGARRVVTAHQWSTSTVCEVAGSREISTTSTCEESSGVSSWQSSRCARPAPRGSGLEWAAMAALGDSDPTYTILQEALKIAKALMHVRPVDERIASSKTFIDRAKKRIGSCREEVVLAQEVLAAQAKHQLEEQSLVEGEARLAAFVAES